jgi:hypothetical protein
MKKLPTTQFISAAIFIALFVGAEAQAAEANEEIEKTLRTFFTCTAARDAEGVRAVLAGKFMGVEAHEDARVYEPGGVSGGRMLSPVSIECFCSAEAKRTPEARQLTVAT